MDRAPFDSDDAPFQRHSGTSIAAAAAIKPSAGTLRAKVLEHLRQCGPHGATDEEMQRALDMNPSTQRPRRIELIEDFEQVFWGGQKRQTTSGRSANVWVLREFAPEGEIAAQLVLNVAAKKAKEDKAAAKTQAALAKASAAPASAPHAPAPQAAAPKVSPPPKLPDVWDLNALPAAPATTAAPSRDPRAAERFAAMKATLHPPAPAARDPFNLEALSAN